MSKTTSLLTAPVLPKRPTELVQWGQLYGAAAPLALSEGARQHAGPILVIASTAQEADRLEAELRFFSELPIVHFPDWETLPYDVFSPHQDIVSQRLETLKRLGELQQGIVVIAASSLFQRLAPRKYVAAGTLMLNAGQKLDLIEFRRGLEAAGYQCVSQVMEHGEFAVRGSLIDIYPTGSDDPYRVDLFDQEVDSIRSFDTTSQRSTGKLDGIRLLPAREFPLTESGIKDFRRRYRARFEGDPTKSQIYRQVSDGIAPGGIEYYLPLFFEQTETLFDYLPASTLVAHMDGFESTADSIWLEIEERFEQCRHDVERPILAPRDVFLPPEELHHALQDYGRINVCAFELEPESQTGRFVNFETQAPPRLLIDGRAEDPAANLLAFTQQFEGRTLLVAESTGRRENLLDILRTRDVRAPVVATWQEFAAGSLPLAITVADIEHGLQLNSVALVAEQQLFGDRAKQRSRRRRAERDPENIIRELSDLSTGSPVVHEDYGVGRYLGLQTLEVGGMANEFLTLEYAGGDKLYVPVHSLQLISRYTGTSPEHAPLHRLGSDQWAKAKKKAAAKIRDVAAELLDIYARRAARTGHSFRIDERDYRAFCAGFPFDETEDQEQAIDQVLEDMTSLPAMDRLVCGDVGFGKTEVALRAAFIAVQDGKQVALLVPTTLLAQQHHQTFSDRFADWPVRVEVLSRFRSPRQTAEILESLQAGTTDIVIGTHKLLQHTVRFKNLGLVIVDEEHRFGVRHKEKLKSLRAEVDWLTLTATPIPRTLNMALGGLRDMSLITTPPAERLAIKTFVSEWNSTMIREACLREIKRGGQIYFVHNKVQTIEKAAEDLAKLVPEAQLAIGHGQMRERDLEQVMLDFYHRRFNVLVCTTIIESGIDVPTANTIVIDRADKFGLAQLHQLRGRVGRSHHRAYAYLITPPPAALTADAVKRLEAIESLEELGAGFILATHDLEIRGAGELLGDEQSGQIQEIGFALYTEFLERAVGALRAGEELDLTAPLDHGPEIDLRIPALIPDDYIPDVHLRLILYKRIASAIDDEALRELQVEMIDRFGLLPEPAKLLFRVTAIKLRASPLGVEKIEANASGGSIVFNRKPNVDPVTLIELLQAEPDTFKFDGKSKLRFSLELQEPQARFEAVEGLLKRLSQSPTSGIVHVGRGG